MSRSPRGCGQPMSAAHDVYLQVLRDGGFPLDAEEQALRFAASIAAQVNKRCPTVHELRASLRAHGLAIPALPPSGTRSLAAEERRVGRVHDRARTRRRY